MAPIRRACGPSRSARVDVFPRKIDESSVGGRVGVAAFGSIGGWRGGCGTDCCHRLVLLQELARTRRRQELAIGAHAEVPAALGPDLDVAEHDRLAREPRPTAARAEEPLPEVALVGGAWARAHEDEALAAQTDVGAMHAEREVAVRLDADRQRGLSDAGAGGNFDGLVLVDEYDARQSEREDMRGPRRVKLCCSPRLWSASWGPMKRA